MGSELRPQSITPRKKVAVIGSGVSGLCAIKSCLDAGLQPTCFEQQSWIGGLWKYSDKVLPNLASVHQNTVTNTSKGMTCFSDFPVPKEFPNFMQRRLVQKYLEMYATRFSLEQYIQFNAAVVRLSRSDDHELTGKWVVSYRKQEQNSPGCDEVLEETFDAVMVCIGHHWDQAKPKIPGIERFEGVQIHSGDYRIFHPFVGKRVVVIGSANSAGDVACELSQHASQVYLSSRRGCYVFERLATGGKPYDMQFSRAGHLLPASIQKVLMSGHLNAKYDFANFCLEPTGIFNVTQHAFINDALLHRVITGSIIVKDEIKEVTETAVIFSEGDAVENVDALVFCTGFKLNFPFAKDIICVKEDHYSNLYKHVFLADVDKNTLAVIGAMDVLGSAFPVIETQTRVAAEVFAGRCTLPTKENMLREVEGRQRQLKKIGVPAQRMIGVDYVGYLDELAAMIGAKPNSWSLFWSDPKLALRCFFGPCVPAQYRLNGPNPWKDAKKVINSVDENYLYPLKTRKCPTSKRERSVSYFFVVVCVACASVILFVCKEVFRF